MKDLFDPDDFEEIRRRIRTLVPESERQWGRMSLSGMVCHLCDAYLMALGDRPSAREPKLHERTLVRFIALHTPLRWPRGVKAVAEVDQEREGTSPTDLAADIAKLETVMERFVRDLDPGSTRHPMFGRISKTEWGRWGYRHADHHLRQFSA